MLPVRARREGVCRTRIKLPVGRRGCFALRPDVSRSEKSAADARDWDPASFETFRGENIPGTHSLRNSVPSLRAAVDKDNRSMNDAGRGTTQPRRRSEEHTSELQSLAYLVCRLLLE